MAEQMIFKRTEMKYMLTAPQYERLRAKMAKYMIPDVHGRSTIQSLYYDTPSFRLIRRSMEHPIYKEKVRARSYGVAEEDTKIFIELKKKYESVVYKRRMQLREKELRTLLKNPCMEETQIGKEIAYCFSYYDDLRPAVLLTYEREAYYDKNDHEFRMTFDQNILWRDYDLDLKKGIYGQAILPEGKVLLEVKTGGAIPKWLVNFLTEEEIYKTSFSKYATAYTHIQKLEKKAQ